MNARALLQAQGWRGEGHTLHATSDSIGLKNRLLVSRKANTSGLGASQYVNDQWWLSALDEQLSGISTKDGKLIQTVKNGKLDRLNEDAGKSELYKFFVSGGTLQGTVDQLPAEILGNSGSKPVMAVDMKPRAFTSSAKLSESDSTPSSSDSGKRKETKEERRARKARKARKAERRQRKEQKRARREARRQKKSATSTDADKSTDATKAAKSETKEERRARRDARRKRKEEKRRLRS